MPQFRYQGKVVTISATADLPSSFRPDGDRAHYVQAALDNTPRWRGDHGTIVQVETGLPVLAPMAVGVLDRNKVEWAIHIAHKAQPHNRDLSPFIGIFDRRGKSDIVTLQLIGTIHGPTLVRAFPGEYAPPLPWMRSVGSAPGGYNASVKYWRHHAYLQRSEGHSLIRPGTLSTTPPDWYL